MYMRALSSSEQQKSFDLTTDGCEPSGFWELNLETVEEKPVPKPLSHLSSPFTIML